MQQIHIAKRAKFVKIDITLKEDEERHAGKEFF